MMLHRLFLLASALTMGWSVLSVSSFVAVRPTTTTTLKPVAALALAKAPPKANDESSSAEYRRWTKASRSAGADDTVVELLRPLGLVLDQYENGDVYVKQVAPKGNAARTGQVKEGDLVTMCSATFGDQMWSTRGAGLSRVLAAIRVRSGSTVKLVLESPSASKKKRDLTTQQLQAREQAARQAQAKKDDLLKELEQTEQKLKKKSFFGLF